MQPTQQPQAQPTPITEDAHATAPQLLDRAATDYATSQAAARAKKADGERRGILTGGRS